VINRRVRDVRARLITLLAVSTVVATSVLAGCGGGGGPLSRQSQALGTIDINAQPRDTIRDGGDLRLPMDLFPGNFNYSQIDGTSGSLNDIDWASLPYLFTGTADGGLKLNPDYLTSATVTSTSPQVITYDINPKATWSDGTPITYRDFQSYWQSLNGTNPGFQISGTTGYDDISSVARGADDTQVVVTFRQPYGEWQGLFWPLTPASLTATPDAFNNAWKTSFPVTAGPFTVASIDLTTKTVTLVRDPKWWGTPAKLDHIIFKVYDTQAEPDALANNELDFFPVFADIDLFRRAQRIQGAVLRNAPGRISDNATFNGSPGAPLADVALRKAIAQGIDRAQLAKLSIGQIVPNPQPDGNHFYAPRSKQYQDNSGVLPYDPTHAAQVLDSLGWVRHGGVAQGGGPNAVRVKNGTQLSLRLVYGLGNSTRELNAKAIQNQLGQLGVSVVLDPVDPNDLFPVHIDRGDFDIALFGWQSTPTPLGSAAGIYQQPLGNNVRQNFGRVGSPQIDALIEQANAELDDTRRAALANQTDRLIWQQAHSVILYARPGAVAERANLANFGARGFADPDYIDAGFLK
jgi:peptide/nickel transport system substrate-binding protein